MLKAEDRQPVSLAKLIYSGLACAGSILYE
jgi:hypothetical protein